MVTYIPRKNIDFCKHFNLLSRIADGSSNAELAQVPLAVLSIGRKIKQSRVRAYLNQGRQGNDYSRQVERFLARHYAQNPSVMPIQMDDVRRFVAQVDVQGVGPAWRAWVKRHGRMTIGASRLDYLG